MHSHGIQHESVSLRDIGLAHQRINLYKLTCQWSPFLPDIHLFLSWNVSFSLKRRSWPQWDYLNKDKTKTNSALSNKLRTTYWENTDIAILGSRQDRSQLSVSANSNCKTHLFPVKDYWYPVISQKFIWQHFHACLYSFFSQTQKPNLLSSTPYSLLFFYFPYSVVRCWKWSNVMQVFQVSAQL